MYCSQNIYLFVYLFNDVNNTHIYIYVSVTHGSEKPTAYERGAYTTELL